MPNPKKSRIKLGAQDYKQLLWRIFSRDNWRCRVCSRRNNLSGHHIKFRSQGGDDAEWNMITLCNSCHEALHDRRLVILPQEEGKPVDANQEVKILFVNGWKPKSYRRAA